MYRPFQKWTFITGVVNSRVNSNAGTRISIEQEIIQCNEKIEKTFFNFFIWAKITWLYEMDLCRINVYQRRRVVRNVSNELKLLISQEIISGDLVIQFERSCTIHNGCSYRRIVGDSALSLITQEYSVFLLLDNLLVPQCIWTLMYTRFFSSSLQML